MANADRQGGDLNPDELDGPALLAGLADGSLQPAHFNHRNHVHAAWQCLRDYPRDVAEQRFASLLQGYVRRLGATHKYHHTLTIALMRLIASRMPTPLGDWSCFAAANVELINDAQTLVDRHYSAALLQSTAARQTFVGPDRLPLP